ASWRPPGPRSCATCTTAGRRLPTGSAPTRWSPAKWIGRTAISRPCSARRKCGTGTGSIPAPSRRRRARCTRHSAPGSRRERRDSGLVDTHPHLELTHLAGRNPEREFSRWIRTIRALKDATTPEEFDHSAEQGVRDCWTAGVTCVADTGSTGAPLRALARLGARGIYYQEVFGPDPAHRAASLTELQAAVVRLAPVATSRSRLGVSPHAPYTVSEPLYRAVAELARREGLALAVHLAESREETALVRDGAGSFAE